MRGFAALLVVWHHYVSFPKTLDPNYTPTGFWAYLAPSHFSVLIFFVLSGYVIGLTNQPPLTAQTIRGYVRKRFVRLYPIYVVCMLLAVLVGWGVGYSWAVILGNLALLQILLVPVIAENAPSWSLHFEVLYYALFIPISFFRIHPVVAALAAFAVAIANVLLFPAHPLLSSYGFGFTFWLTGLILARYAGRLPHRQHSYQLLLAVLLIFTSFQAFNAPTAILQRLTAVVAGNRLEFLPGGDTFTTILSFYDLAWLPYAVLGIIVFAHKGFRHQKVVLGLLLLVPAFTARHILAAWPSFDVAAYGLPSLCYGLGLLLLLHDFAWVERLAKPVIGGLARIGTLSYGLYIVHFPFMLLAMRLSFFSGSAFTFWVRFAVAVGASLLTAYVLEKKFQPWVKARLL
ncbi:acyltransferase family protein [Hymenobacter daecheongensis]|nr:acyltransferase family protein [Hymenobacter daecheongensis]